MANSKDNISKYATSFIGFDEANGNVYDNIGGYVGTVYNAPTMVAGWNGEGYAMSFNGSNQYVIMNNRILNSTTYSIRFKIKTATKNGNVSVILDTNGYDYSKNGFMVILQNGMISVFHYNSTLNGNYISSNKDISDNQWHDVLITSEGVVGGLTKFYIDDMVNPCRVFTNTLALKLSTLPMYIGYCTNVATIISKFNGQLDQIEIYDRIISPITDKHLILHNNQYKYHDSTQWQITTATEENFIKYGHDDLSHITEAQWTELVGDKSIVVWSDFEDKQYVSAVLEKEPFTAKDLIGDNAELIVYTTSNAEQITILTETDGYSVYDYISELPTVVAYTESTDDIIVSTGTEPFDLYDEFGDELEVLYYTDDETINEANLVLEANWSPIDELEGDFEVLQWTNEESVTAQRMLEMTAVPKPQFIRFVNPYDLFGYLGDVVALEQSETYRFKNPVRYLFTDENTETLYKWDFNNKEFIDVTSLINTNDDIKLIGMSYDELDLLTFDDWITWSKSKLGIAIYLEDNPRDTILSNVDRLSFEGYNPRDTVEISEASFYILNTTARIDLELIGNSVIGILDDADLTKVQYRVMLNGVPYYPVDGSFTNLSAPPQNISISFSSSDVEIDDWNTVRIEFKDSFDTVDFWQTQFMGTYSGILFKDVYGDYYSNEIGEVLKYLDFGTIIAGQTTIEHEVILKNQYGYDLKNINLYANTSEFPSGMSFEFSDSLSPFNPNSSLSFGNLANGEEKSFYVRISTELDAVPNHSNIFDIIVKADKDE